MAWDSLDEDLVEIYERIERKITLSDCQTAEDIKRKLKTLQKISKTKTGKKDGRIDTLIKRGFPEKVIERGLTGGWWIGIFSNTPDIVRKVRRDRRGRFQKGHITIPFDEFMKNIDKYVPKDQINEVKRKILEKREKILKLRRKIEEMGVF